MNKKMATDMVVMDDLKRNLKHNKLSRKSPYLKMFNNLSNFDYDREYVSAPAAYGDTFKYLVRYDIGPYAFKYQHVNCEGNIIRAKFTITIGDTKETIFKYSSYTEMAKRFGMDIDEDDTFGQVFHGFIKKYKLEPKLKELQHIFAIFNAFTNGCCINLVDLENYKSDIDYFSLTEIINVL